MNLRFKYLFVTIVIIILGLLSRKFMFIFPKAIAPYVGDAFWASMVYFGVRFLFPKLSLGKSFIIAIIFSYLIEISQIYQADWINNIRNTTLGGLILGHGFLYEDLIAYAIGILLSYSIEKINRKSLKTLH